jgi:hypothetical protein
LSFQLSLPFWLSNQYPIYIPLLPIRATCPAHLILLDLIVLIKLGQECNLWSSALILQHKETQFAQVRAFDIPVGNSTSTAAYRDNSILTALARNRTWWYLILSQVCCSKEQNTQIRGGEDLLSIDHEDIVDQLRVFVCRS